MQSSVLALNVKHLTQNDLDYQIKYVKKGGAKGNGQTVTM